MTRSVFSTLLVASVCATVHADLKTEFQSRYDQLTMAYLTKNVKVYDRLIAPDYQGGIQGKKPSTKKDLLAHLKASRTQSGFKTGAKKVLTVTAAGNKATAMVEVVTTGSVPRKSGPAHQLRMTVVWKDIWVKNPTGWQLQRATAVKDEVLLDGKPYLPAQRSQTGMKS